MCMCDDRIMTTIKNNLPGGEKGWERVIEWVSLIKEHYMHKRKYDETPLHS
jgi:hypothetical protein